MIKAEISAITSNDGVTLFEFCNQNLKLKMLGLENLQGLKIGDSVRLNFKSSDVVIAAAPLKNCSLSNEIKAQISGVSVGQIVSVLHLKSLDLKPNFEFESIISTASFRRLNLTVNLQIYAYIKATSLYIDGLEHA